MIAYQVDESADSKKLVNACRQEALVDIQRFPHRLKGQKDPEVLAELLPAGRTLVTTDRSIHTDHAGCIPENHSGILIIADTSSPNTLTMRRVMDILSAFKSHFGKWHTVSLRNFVVEITESSVEVSKVSDGVVQRVAFIRLNEDNWSAMLLTALSTNARSVLPPPPS
jgi:hypothetical protein